MTPEWRNDTTEQRAHRAWLDTYRPLMALARPAPGHGAAVRTYLDDGAGWCEGPVAGQRWGRGVAGA